MTARPEAVNAGHVLAALEQLHDLIDSSTALLTRLAGSLMSNDVLYSGTVVLQDGMVSLSFGIPYATVAIDARGVAGGVTIASQPAGPQPSSGIGVHVIAADLAGTYALIGTELTIWGPVGATVGVQVLTRTTTPAFA